MEEIKEKLKEIVEFYDKINSIDELDKVIKNKKNEVEELKNQIQLKTEGPLKDIAKEKYEDAEKECEKMQADRDKKRKEAEKDLEDFKKDMLSKIRKEMKKYKRKKEIDELKSSRNAYEKMRGNARNTVVRLVNDFNDGKIIDQSMLASAKQEMKEAEKRERKLEKELEGYIEIDSNIEQYEYLEELKSKMTGLKLEILEERFNIKDIKSTNKKSKKKSSKDIETKSKVSKDIKSENKEPESKDSKDIETESKEPESKDSKDIETESKEPESKDSKDIEPGNKETENKDSKEDTKPEKSELEIKQEKIKNNPDLTEKEKEEMLATLRETVIEPSKASEPEHNDSEDNKEQKELIRKVNEAKRKIEKMYVDSTGDKNNTVIHYFTADSKGHMEVAKYKFKDNEKEQIIINALKIAYPSIKEQELLSEFTKYRKADPNIVRLLAEKGNTYRLEEYRDILNEKTIKKGKAKEPLYIEYDISKLSKSNMSDEEKEELENYAFQHRNIAKVKKNLLQTIKFAFKGFKEKLIKSKDVKALNPGIKVASLKYDTSFSDEFNKMVNEKNVTKENNMQKNEKRFKELAEKANAEFLKETGSWENSYWKKNMKIENSSNQLEIKATENINKKTDENTLEKDWNKDFEND